MKKGKLFIILMIVFAFCLSACSKVDTDKTPLPDKNTPTDTDEDNNEDEIDELTAYNLFVDLYHDPVVTKVEYEKHNDEAYYTIKGFRDVKDLKTKFYKSNGKVKEDIQESVSNHDNDISIQPEHIKLIKPIIDDARKNADADAVLKEWSLESEKGKLRLEVEIDQANDTEIKYDLDSGQVIETDD